MLRREVFGHGHVGSRSLILHGRGRVAIGAQHPRTRRNDHRPGLRQDAHGVTVKRPCAAEGHQRKIAWVVTLFDRNQAQSPEHRFVDDLDDSLGCLHQPDAHGIGDLLDGFFRCRLVNRHLAAELHVGRQVAQYDVRVAHGRLLPALQVGRRPRHGPGRLGAHPERPRELRHESDGTTAGAHRAHVHRRRPHRDVTHPGFASHPCPGSLDQSHVRRRSAHVEGQHVVIARPAGEIDGARHPSRGAGQQQVYRGFGSGARGGQSTVGAQYRQLEVGAHFLLERSLQIGDVF